MKAVLIFVKIHSKFYHPLLKKIEPEVSLIAVELRKVKNLRLDFWNGSFTRIFSYSKLSCMGIHTIFTHIFICSQSLATKGSDVNLFGGIILFFKKTHANIASNQNDGVRRGPTTIRPNET